MAFQISSQLARLSLAAIEDIKTPSGKAEPFRASGGKAAPKSLVLEMPYTCKNHCEIMLIGSGDYFIIAH